MLETRALESLAKRIGALVSVVLACTVLTACSVSTTAVGSAEEPAGASPCGCAVCPPQPAPGPFSYCERDENRVCTDPEIAIPDGFERVDTSKWTPQQYSDAFDHVVQVSGKGGVCCGIVAQAKGQSAVVYRAYGGTAKEYGAWWSPTDPRLESKQQYRAHDDLCTDWNSLASVAACQIEAGTQVVIGPGQSVCCCPDQAPCGFDGPAYYAPSDDLQINIYPANETTVKNCQTAEWSEAGPAE